MRIDRAIVMRGLNIVGVSGIDQIVITKEGNVCHPSPDRTIFVYGNLRIKGMDEDWVLPDLSLFARMLKSFTSATVEITRVKSSFQMVGDGIQWKYRLGNREVIQSIDSEVVADLLSSLELGTTVSVDVMKRLASVQSIIKAAYIHFVAKKGKFHVIVGEEETYNGVIDLEASFDEDFDLKIPADRLIEIVDKIDNPTVELKFGTGNKKIIQVALPDFSWIVGAVKEAKE